MGVELEYKLAVPTPGRLEAILFNPQVAEVQQESYRLYNMATVYYDTPDRRLGAMGWTLRLRQENEQLIATVKTPLAGRARGEWEVPAVTIRQAIPLLLEQGAPEQLRTTVEGQELVPLCAAQFTRRAANLKLGDGTVCELSGDVGLLTGGGNEEDLCEVEVELKSGSADMVQAFAEELQDRFELHEEPRSKFARALALTRR